MNDNELVPIENTGEMISPVDVEGAVEYWEQYTKLTEQILDKSDYQKIGKKTFKKKSAWRKYQAAFNISDEIVKEELQYNESRMIITAKYTVKATAPNGRTSEGVGVCSIYDKIKATDKEMPSDFQLRQRYSQAEHDIPSTAHTRAKSRAIADLIGTGEVTAEEIEKELNNMIKKPRSPIPIKPKKTKEPEPTMKIDELISKNQTIKEAVEIIETKGDIADRKQIEHTLLDLLESGKINENVYKGAKGLLTHYL